MDFEDHPDDVFSGESRRSFLKKSAIAGGLVWAAPVVSTVHRSFAQAQVDSPVCCSAQATALFSTGDVVIQPQGQASCTNPGPNVVNDEINVNLGAIPLVVRVLTGEASCEGVECAAEAQVAGVELGGPGGLVIEGLESIAAVNCETCGYSGSATAARITLGGEPLAIPFPCNANIPLGPLLDITFNEQTCDNGTYTVTGLHIVVLDGIINPQPVADVYIAQSQVSAPDCDCSTAVCATA